MDFANWNWVDYAFTGIVAFGLLHGIFRGLSRFLGNLFGLVIAIFGTRWFFDDLAHWITANWSWHPEVARLAAILLLLFGLWFIMRLVFIGLAKMMTFSFKGWVERIGGMLAGGLWYGLLFLVLMWMLSFIPWSPLQRAILFDSVVGRATMPFLQTAYNAIADKASLSKSNIPIGVEAEPHAILPPGAEDWVEEATDKVEVWADEIPRFFKD